jgi:acyl-CoA synthetase (AMP-forming)/AMP-acid ligase II
VCLSAGEQLQAARALAQATAPLGITRHLNLLPLPVLLENIAGVYGPLMAGATCICPALEETGLRGSSAFDPVRCLDAMARYQPDSIILLPQMLQALVAQLAHDGRPSDPRIASLKLAAVGGGRTPAALICRARELGLPVYEGYGLSECASVVALNLPGADRPGTVGRALPGTLLRLSDAGEIEVSGRSFSGYLGAALPPEAAEPAAAQWLATGDLGAIDEQGYVTIIGRSRNVIITGYGRNVSPEWPEGLLLESPAIAQAAVFGEARPMLVAAIVPASAGTSDAAIDAALARANEQLPDYARIGAWLRVTEPFSPANGLATTNGRLRRDRIRDRHAAGLNALYPTNAEVP